MKTSNDPPFTPEATVGPFYPGIFCQQMPADLTSVSPILVHCPQGQPIALSGRFIDSDGLPVRSLIVQFWQANAYGRYRHPADRSGRPLDPHFDVFVRLRTADDGTFRFRTIRPGPHPVREDSGLIL